MNTSASTIEPRAVQESHGREGAAPAESRRPRLGRSRALPFRSSHPGHLRRRLILIALAGLACRAGFADEPPRSAAEPALRYRQLFVPADEIAKLDRVYLPVKHSEFEQLLQAIQARHAAAGANLDARLAEATYSARVVGTALTGGRADLSLVHHGNAPCLLPLEPLGLAINAPTWIPAEPAVKPSSALAKPADDPAAPSTEAGPAPPASRHADRTGRGRAPGRLRPNVRSTAVRLVVTGEARAAGRVALRPAAAGLSGQSLAA